MNRRMLISGFVATLLLVGSSMALAERQPKMNQALHHLLKAEAALMAASRDKGGHRVAALEHVRKAIRQVRKGKRFDNRN